MVGHHDRHYAGDRRSVEGFWGVPSSMANFCEEDYAFTFYIAEFINTLSNFAYVYFAVRHPGKYGKDSLVKFDFMAISMLVLGVNSFVFHASLRQTTQLGDDLSMLLLAGALLHGIFIVGQTATTARITGIGIWAAVSVIAGVYVQTAYIPFHVYAFLSMLGAVGARTLLLVYGRGLDASTKSRLMGRFWRAVVALVVAYTLWNIDLEMCPQLRKLKESIGLPWAWVLELHGWWHVLTAVGASVYINLIRDLDGVFSRSASQARAKSSR